MWESGGCSALSPKDFGSPEGWTESCPGAGYKSRSRLAGLLSRRNTASHRCILHTRHRALPLCPPRNFAEVPLSLSLPKGTKKTGGTTSGASRKKLMIPRLPTAALSASGVRVEGGSFLSARQHELPCLFCCEPIIDLCPRPVNRFREVGCGKISPGPGPGAGGQSWRPVPRRWGWCRP